MAIRLASRKRARVDDSQLEFFQLTAHGFEAAHPVRTPRPEPLAGASPQADGGARHDEGLLEGRGSNREGAGRYSPDSSSAEILTPTVPRPEPGDGAEEISLPPVGPRRAEVGPEPARNRRNYRIRDTDRIGIGSAKSKCRANIAALELLKRLEAEERAATADEKQVLVRYVGWGGLPQVFDTFNAEWKQERERLESILNAEELESARATTLNAHYTSPAVIRAMYALLGRLGFEQGRILEPACGIGHFIGVMPDEIHGGSLITGIEIDSVTARIAKVLYPDADIRHQPFEEARLADGFYDVAISNIPFGDYRPFDPRFKGWRFVIHDYFFAAALERIRDGGLILFVTSKGTLDKVDGALREYVAQKADLVAAIRLPNDAFKRNANTEVTADIVILQKRRRGELPGGPAWRSIVQITNSLDESIPVNEYFAAHPEMMLGEMRLDGRMYRSGEPTLVGNGRDLEEQLMEVIALLPRDIYRAEGGTNSPSAAGLMVPAPEHVKPNAYVLLNGEIAVREGDAMRVLTGLPGQKAQRIRGMIRVRDAARRCLRAQLESRDESEVVLAREQLNQAYDSFVAKFRALSEPANTLAFRGDPDLPLLLSLERFDEETRRATKAAIFRERTIQRSPPAPVVNTPRDALLVTLNMRGTVDVDHVCSLLHSRTADVLSELRGAIFLNPQTNRWETEDEYLSGNVRAKLAAAEGAMLADEQFQANVDALKAVQPVDLSATEIDARLGSTWIPSEDIGRFVEELLGENGVQVSHAPQLGLWLVRGSWQVKMSVANTTEWGTDRRDALSLVEDALNLRTPTVYDHDDELDRDVVNVAATEAARDKQEKIKERFKGWIWQDDGRQDRLVRKYNDEFNNIRLRTFSGDHLTLPGASPVIALHRHQKAAVWRILQTPNCLLAHVVGAGKTFTMVAAAMELKRLGLARKPLFAVPNHMLGQFSSELLSLYPGANILVASKEDFEKTRRQTLMSRIATGNWDAVIVTHSGFEKIPVLRATQEEFFKEQLRELTLAVEQQRQQEDSRMVKILERAKKRLESRLKELAADGRKDDGLTFEELGVDRLFIDEAHTFKNLFYVSKMTRIAGLPQTASQRALDMFLKVCHVQRINGGGGVVFATGTPIANSVAEMFTMQRYLQMAALRALQVAHFDSWAATFGEPVTSMELAPDGSGYRLNTRFCRFINVPELMQQFRQVADIQTQSMLKLAVPELRHGKPIVVGAPCSPELKDIVASLVERAEALRTGSVDPRDDNMLLVTTDGRKAALDLRLSDGSLPDHPKSKVNLAVAEIHRIWRETSEARLTQLVFCDLSTPTGGKGFSVYEDIRDKLVALGVPASEIAFIQEYESDGDKVRLFRNVRAGKVRILLGSTQKMGAGTNVQERLIALHHLDAPWRPADVEQREGRILRQGNSNAEVQIYRYVTESSFDAYMWQTLETKARFIAQVMTGESDLRRIEDVDGAALTYAEVKAIASGNPLVIEKASVDAEVARLTRLQSQHHETEFRVRQRVRHLTEELPRLERRLEALRRDLAVRQSTRGDQFVIQIEGQTIRDRGIAGELINRRAEKVRGSRSERRIGTFAGFELCVVDTILQGPEVVLRGSATHGGKLSDSALGTIRSLEHSIQSLDERVSGLEAEMESSTKRVQELREQIGQPFEYAERLAELVKRQAEIADALDLTKNQASNGLESDSAADVAVASEAGAMSLGELGFGDYAD